MAVPEAIDRALHSPVPFEALRSAALALFEKGETEQEVCDLFEAARVQLRLDGQEAEEDLVMDAMDCLVNWWSPHLDLKPTARANKVMY